MPPVNLLPYQDALLTTADFGQIIADTLESRYVADIRDEVIGIYAGSGKRFLDWCKEYGCTERGEIKWSPHFEEFFEAVGDLRIHEVNTSGPAQVCGKSIAHHNLIAWVLIELGLNIINAYDQEQSLQDNVPTKLRRILDKIVEKKNTDRPGKRNDHTYQYGRATLFNVAAGQARGSLRKGRAAVSSNLASKSGDFLVGDERSQFPTGATDIMARRLDNSVLETQPLRFLGTPGSGGGIEVDIERCDYHFYPHVCCPGCDRVYPLDPKGCLLQSTTLHMANGQTKQSYFDETGRPKLYTDSDGNMAAAWFHRDPLDPKGSAYISCPHPDCGIELENEVRSQAKFQCLNTGITLREFLDNLPDEPGTEQHRIAIQHTPLTQTPRYNLAASIIRSGIDTKSPADFQQQRLGWKSELQANRITQDMIDLAIGAPILNKKPDYVLAGADVGTTSDWLAIAEYHLPDNRRGMTVQEIINNTVRIVRFAGDIVGSEIPDRLKLYGVQYGLIDSKPTVTSAVQRCDVSCLELAIQKDSQLSATKESEVLENGTAYPCRAIRTPKFKQQLLDTLLRAWVDHYPLMRLPASWRQWQGEDGSARSPIRHLKGPHLVPDTGQWIRPEDHVDDIFMALVFCEAAFYLMLTGEAGTDTQGIQWLKNMLK